MNLDLTRFLIGKTVAEREGVDDQRANQLGLLGGLVGSPVIGYLVVREAARREAPPPPVTSEPPPGGTGSDPVNPTEEVVSMARQARDIAAAANEAASAALAAANEAKQSIAQLTTRVEALETMKP